MRHTRSCLQRPRRCGAKQRLSVRRTRCRGRDTPGAGHVRCSLLLHFSQVTQSHRWRHAATFARYDPGSESQAVSSLLRRPNPGWQSHVAMSPPTSGNEAPRPGLPRQAASADADRRPRVARSQSSRACRLVAPSRWRDAIRRRPKPGREGSEEAHAVPAHRDDDLMHVAISHYRRPTITRPSGSESRRDAYPRSFSAGAHRRTTPVHKVDCRDDHCVFVLLATRATA